MEIELNNRSTHQIGRKVPPAAAAESTGLLQPPDGASEPASDDGTKASDNAMFANLFLLFFGSGTFAMPWGFARAGVLGGSVGVCAVAGVTYATISMLVATKKLLLRRLSEQHAGAVSSESLQRSLSYAAIASHALGTPLAGSVVKAATTFSSLGACGGYLTFVTGLLLPMVVRFQGGGLPAGAVIPGGEMTQGQLLCLLLPLLIPLTWVRSFSGLAAISTIGNFIFMMAGATVLFDGFTRFGLPSLEDFGAAGTLKLWPEDFGHAALFVSPCIFMFTIHYCALPIEAEAKVHPSPTANVAGAAPLPPHRSVLPLYASPGPVRRPASPAGDLSGDLSGAALASPPSSQSQSGFNGSLRLALICSALLNATFGACAYVTFGRAPFPPLAQGSEVEGCDPSRPYMCDDVVKNVAAGPAQFLVSISLVLNLAISYVLMLAASRQYMEAAWLELLVALAPATFAPNDSGPCGVRGAMSGEQAGAQAVEEEAGQWVAGRDGWPRALARNALRTALVLLTTALCLAVPHFALLSGLIGGLTDSLQSLVLPPLLYLAESRRAPHTQAATRHAAVGYAAISDGDSAGGDGATGARRRMELVLCGSLASFGLCFIAFATQSNLAAISTFLNSPQQTGAPQ